MDTLNQPLSESNFILYCAQHYDGRYCCSTEEFYEDLKRIGYIKKLVTRFQMHNELKERLILNHIITLNNVFGPTVTSRILYFKLKDHFSYVKPFLVFLEILPDTLYNIDGNNIIDIDMIPLNPQIVEALRKI